MVKELKKYLYKELKEFMMEKLYNKRKAKAGLVSLQNQLIGDINCFLNDWSETEEMYHTMTHRTGGFVDDKG